MVATSDPANPAPAEDVVQAVRAHILPLAPVVGGGLFAFAISLATNEVAHQLRSPGGDIVLGKTELPVLGKIIWQTYTEATE